MPTDATRATRRRGRPPGTTGQAPVFTEQQIKLVFRVARARPHHALRAELTFALSISLGLRAKEIASLRWADVYDAAGNVRETLHLKAAYTKGAKTRDVFLSSARLRQLLEKYAAASGAWLASIPTTPLLRSQKRGHMTAGSVARFLKELYREAGLPQASSHSGRRTLITQLAERGIDLKSISRIAGHSNVRTTAMYVEANPLRLSRILKDVTW